MTVDTVLSLEKNVTLGISRDSSLAMIFGTVKDEDNRPLADATVQVLDMKTVSDGMGNFQLPIPAEKQKEEQRVTVYKDGYQLWDFTGPVSDKVPWKIIVGPVVIDKVEQNGIVRQRAALILQTSF